MGQIREFKLGDNQKYFDELMTELSEASILQYKSTCGRFLEQINKSLLKIDSGDVETFIENNGKSVAQVKNMTAHIRKLYRVMDC